MAKFIREFFLIGIAWISVVLYTGQYTFLLLTLILIVTSLVIFYASSYRRISGNGFLATIFNKGKYGEFQLICDLERTQIRRFAVNIYIPIRDGEYTEVDVIGIDKTGIYVFEMKNYKGWIYGNEKQTYWTQTLNKGTKHQFLNPIHQNNGHIHALARQLNLPLSSFFSYIVFGKDAEFKTKFQDEENDYVKIINITSLKRRLTYNLKYRPQIFTNEVVNEIYARLNSLSFRDKSFKRAHIARLQAKKRQA